MNFNLEELTFEEKTDFDAILKSVCENLGIDNLHNCADETCKFYNYGSCDKLEYLYDIFILSRGAE